MSSQPWGSRLGIMAALSTRWRWRWTHGTACLRRSFRGVRRRSGAVGGFYDRGNGTRGAVQCCSSLAVRRAEVNADDVRPGPKQVS